ncbi:DUF6153 family protein [Streptomyces hesseae]|uniref:DUF6153 family protein n=1 Tax=Streptomyces hesseae TaxID=3075519 RepID=A0ABU2SZS9_9ACTN|nr:DUF6153 family protein [Streptomyces sp. DSM 40473]MDT0453405.1 DUF6153 family protein [Streptomyces sp. DSM 40473]
MSTGQSRRRALARLPAVCAVLLGLFLMHGAPASAATGCHAAMEEQHVTAPAEHAAHGEHRTVAGMAPAASRSSTHMDSQAVTGEHGTLCVATAARDRFPLPTIWLLAAAAFAGLAAWGLVRRRMAAGGAGRRGPPDGGRALLLRKCVARN